MFKKNLKFYLITTLVCVLAVGGVVLADTIVNNYYGDVELTQNAGEPGFGAVAAVGGVCDGNESATQLCNVNAYELQVQTDVTIDDDLVVTGDVTYGSLVVGGVGSITATTTLTSASESVQLLPVAATTTTITLPAVTEGLKYTFLVTGALTSAVDLIIDSAEGDNINGALRVADAAVQCVDEDQINIICDGEVIGDTVVIMSDGTGWYILSSEVETSSKMTCTDPS